jgi:hypothetical protein
VTIIGADFAPSSLPPAQRIRLFARHLPEFGWEPTVITTDPCHYECAVDEENERLLPPGLRVVRTSALPVRWTRRVGVGDVGMRSLWHHWRCACRRAAQGEVDLLFLPVPPFVPMVLGRLLHARYGVPYVVDYIDPWVSDAWRRLPREQWPPKRALADLTSRLLEPFALRKVGHVVGVSPGTTQGVVRRYRWLRESDATDIPYGAEAADFDYLRAHPRRNRIFDAHDGLRHVSYAGACIPPMHETVRAIFAAVAVGLRRRPQLFGRLRLHFVGTTYAPDASPKPQVLPLAEEAGLAAVVDEHPARVSYLDALQLLLDSHGLLLIGSDAPHYTASKLFPYVLSGRPLVGVFHQASSAIGMLRATTSAEVVSFGDGAPPLTRVSAIQQALDRILTVPAENALPIRSEALDQYSARTMARRLAAVFDRVATGHERPPCR